MILTPWEELPDTLKTDAVRPYYDALAKKRGSLLAKRVFDITVAFVMLVLLSPVFLILAVAIKLDSSGPVFYRQTRITALGKEFRIFKFRTMVQNADQIGTQVTVNNDSRITRIGRMLRKCRLDEIGQLLNVLNGSMTFVGVRPEVPKYVAHYKEEMMATLLLPAGITSKTSVYYMDEEVLLNKATDADKTYIEKVLPVKMQYNLQGILEFSFFGDIKIMFMTVAAMFGKVFNEPRK